MIHFKISVYSLSNKKIITTYAYLKFNCISKYFQIFPKQPPWLITVFETALILTKVPGGSWDQREKY